MWWQLLSQRTEQILWEIQIYIFTGKFQLELKLYEAGITFLIKKKKSITAQTFLRAAEEPYNFLSLHMPPVPT